MDRVLALIARKDLCMKELLLITYNTVKVRRYGMMGNMCTLETLNKALRLEKEDLISMAAGMKETSSMETCMERESITFQTLVEFSKVNLLKIRSRAEVF